jgi:hypothetical protein
MCSLIAAFGYAAEPVKLAPLKFLLGRWEAVSSGKHGEASAGSATFSRNLQERVITRTSYAEYPAGNSRPAFRHEDLMVIYVDIDSLVKADYYDNEGHVIRYHVRTPSDSEAVFVSTMVSGSPTYRLTYRMTAVDQVSGTFEFAPPGKPDAFTAYMSWVTRKVGMN